MERNRDLKRATIAGVNGLQKRRQRIRRDSTDEDRQMELQGTVRLRDRERLQKKDRDRELPKRRRVDRSAVQQRSGGGESYRENDSTDSSHDEYYEEDETRIHQQNRSNQLSPTSSSLSNNRRGLRTLRSSPVLRVAADEMLSFPVPRRARSATAKRFHEFWNSGSGVFGEDLGNRRFSPSPASVNPTGSGGASSSSSGASMKKKMKSVEPRTRVYSNSSNSKLSSVVQDDIDEIEVAEALFDLMKQSQSCQNQEQVDRDSTNTADDELKKLKAEGGKDENNAFSVQNEQSMRVNAETIVVDSVTQLKQEGRIEKEKFPDDPAKKLVSGDGFVNKGKVGSRKESESPSCVKVNACDIQDPTVTKADYAATVVEATKGARLEIDLMAPPSLPSSPERDDLVDMATDPKVTTQKSETISEDGSLAVERQMQEEKIGGISSNPLPNLDLEKRSHDISSVSDSTSQQKQVPKEQKNQSPTSLLPFPIGIGMSGWPGVLPHSGYMPPLQAVLPIDGSARSSMIMLPPPFKFSESRRKRCATHQYIAHNIRYHQQLINKSLSSGPSGPATLYGTKQVNLKAMIPTQKFVTGNPSLGDHQAGQSLATISSGSGKDKSSDAAAALNATASAKSAPQQATYQGPANNLLHGSGFIFPLGHHQTTMMAPANSSGPPQSVSTVGNASLLSNSAGRPPVNLPLPGGSPTVSLTHPMLSSHEAAAYMALLQNNGCPIPISTNIPMPSFRGGTPTVPFFNSPFYSSPVYNVTQNQQQLSLPHAPVQSVSQHTSTFSSSSANKQPHSQHQTSTKISDNKFPASITAQLPQPDNLPQPSHTASKPDTEISGKSGASVADGLSSHSVKPNNIQTCSFPVPAVNFAVIPPMSINVGALGNHHGDPPQQGSKGRVELIPQAFALSFGSNASTALDFSSMAQNSTIFQMLPEMPRSGDQMTQQKNFQTPEGKFRTSGSFNFSKSGCMDISALPSMGTSKLDGLARTINFLPSTSVLTSGVSATTPNFQQHQHLQQPIQIQKHHMHQMQLPRTAQVKASTSNSISTSLPSSSFPSKSTNASAQIDNFGNSTLVNIPQLRTSQGQTHITFGNSSVSAALSQGHQNMTKSQPMSPLIVGSSAGSSQETEPSPNGTGQKSSPACRRIVPSILSTCPSQVSEIKY
ncbi:hypothetical protein CDL12_09077 [Handroanthus impetiginosus]|uniref:Protein TIME FOR COFFEE-like n=1 Tax=Handroanthus impetiginosus TaxID=429701 RepID=A0A2G9HL49_9LAMI|nr:hypothetical protein CDL12_09077 [Handroanthus impetiginosus]